MPQVEVFTPTGVVGGSTARAMLGSDAGGAPEPLLVEAGRWYPLDGGPPERLGAITVPADEILVVILGTSYLATHSSWYPIELGIGPYELEASLSTPPGFDPERALARPTGAYVTVRDVAISLPDRPGAAVAEREWAHVNRYAVERVASDLMLGVFFPGATQRPLHVPGGELPAPTGAGRSRAY